MEHSAHLGKVGRVPLWLTGGTAECGDTDASGRKDHASRIHRLWRSTRRQFRWQDCYLVCYSAGIIPVKDIRPALRIFLLGYAPINSAVGGSRIYAVKMPQGVVADSIVYNRVSGGGTYIMDGLSGFTIQRFQFDVWSSSVDSANTLADHIRDRMDGYRGNMISGAVTIQVHGIFMIDQRDDYDDTVQLTRMSRDYSIAFKEL